MNLIQKLGVCRKSHCYSATPTNELIQETSRKNTNNFSPTLPMNQGREFIFLASPGKGNCWRSRSSPGINWLLLETPWAYSSQRRTKIPLSRPLTPIFKLGTMGDCLQQRNENSSPLAFSRQDRRPWTSYTTKDEKPSSPVPCSLFPIPCFQIRSKVRLQ
jgi:hypothetical protein